MRRSLRSLVLLVGLAGLGGCGYNRLQGLDEQVNKSEGEIKVQRDSRTDRSSITTMPPVKVKARVGQKKQTYGPGVELPVAKMDDMEVMAFGAPDPTSVEVERSTKHDVNEFVGRRGELGLRPQPGQREQHRDRDRDPQDRERGPPAVGEPVALPALHGLHVTPRRPTVRQLDEPRGAAAW